MKQRFSTLDICVQVKELEFLKDKRLSNVYDLNSKTFIFKFNDKTSLLIESGTRFHTTNYKREYAALSNINVKLRKHLKNKRLVQINQLGNDRRIDLHFGENEFSFHVILEFFAQGNLILTDHEYKIMTILRKHENTAVGDVYELPPAAGFEKISEDAILSGFNKVKENWETRKKQSLTAALRSIFGKSYGPSLVEFALIQSGLNATSKDISPFSDSQSPEFKKLISGFKKCDDLIENCLNGKVKGYIRTIRQADYVAYDDFQPFEPWPLPNSENIVYETFNEAVDQFYTVGETKKAIEKVRQAEIHAAKKLEAVKKSSESQVIGFQITREKKEAMAKVIEQNISLVDACIQTVQNLVTSGMHWNDIQEMIDQEKENENTVALAISGLKLIESKITITLPILDDEFEYDEYTDFNDFEKIDVDVDINKSAYSNARSFYDAKKVAVVKEQKTIAASKQALITAEKKIMATLEKKSAQQPSITRARIAQWYEPFIWFITTENYLVIGGRDATQNEQLLTRYFKNGDFLLHSDMPNAPIALLKSFDQQTTNIPHTSLQQASTLIICHSKAWEGKIVSAAYWLRFDQVSKIQSGTVLAPGLYRIIGEKNWLPPVQLNYGVALAWEIDDNSVERHRLERRPWMRVGVENAVAGKEEIIENAVIEEKGDIANAQVEIQAKEKEDVGDSENSLETPPVGGEGIEKQDSAEVLAEPAEVEKLENTATLTDAPDEKARGKARISAKERRKIKKGSTNIISETVGRDSELSSVTSSNNSTANLPRGKKSKMKKLKEKYADQDEEDRERMMAKIDASKYKPPIEPVVPSATPSKREAKPKKDPILVLEDSASFKVPETNLDYITFQPHADDTLISCIPVCAPWTALQKAKYKVKLVPGSLKKGKAAKQVQHILQGHLSKIGSEKEKELLECVSEVEWINATLGKSKPK